MTSIEYRNAAGCIVLNGNNEVLLLRRSINETSYHGLYELPGGKHEENNTNYQDTAKLETYEESGLLVDIKDAFPPHVDEGMKKIYYGYLAACSAGEEVTLSSEHDEYIWICPESALHTISPLSHHARYFLEKLLKIFK